MDNANYVALSRQITLQRELDISANNLANMNTTGYKFEQLLVGTEQGAPAYDAPIKSPANFAYDNGVGRDFRQGPTQQTGGTYDLAIDGEGAFFSVQTPQGTRYTRDGAFTLGPDGTLQTQDGYPVQSSGGPIVIDPKKGAPVISADGIVSQDFQGRSEQIGTISLVRISDMSSLSKEGNGLYNLKAGATTQPATDAQLHQGMLESSNVNPMTEVTHLIQINRAYTQLTNMMEQNLQLSTDAISRLGKVA
jgi:flagellar basal-body rod protein FlgF